MTVAVAVGAYSRHKFRYSLYASFLLTPGTKRRADAGNCNNDRMLAEKCVFLVEAVQHHRATIVHRITDVASCPYSPFFPNLHVACGYGPCSPRELTSRFCSRGPAPSPHPPPIPPAITAILPPSLTLLPRLVAPHPPGSAHVTLSSSLSAQITSPQNVCMCATSNSPVISR